ncbi:RNA polymerase sigma-70 factor [Aestuariibaculum sp. YM273]|uniref:RNA polymerase sigma factor n=1 Tax=Aestuariibaculum sp. YM273 TaxID=3070659 RepID=UPI0027DB2A57|nr:RNA polymerase sigma-70 factor [Aestuariibaculum sp. YM273]WMI64124.1 RNA polymerase sigma-70 factor [Aestuariibaculum sp. YM273]
MHKKENINLAFNAIKNGNRKAFERLYSDYYEKLCTFLLGYTDDEIIVEDIVQDVFLKIWTNRKKINITTSLNSYLYKTAYITLMGNYRELKKKNNMLSTYYYTALIQASDTDDDEKTSLIKKLKNCIDNLPERSKEVFQENKISGLKYSEVAKKLDISIKTVEGHISRALSFIRSCMH